MFLWTQVNLSTIKIVMQEMSIPEHKTHTIMQKWGYTGSACIPMVMHDAIEEGKIKPGDNIVLCASGGGLNMALFGDEVLGLPASPLRCAEKLCFSEKSPFSRRGSAAVTQVVIWRRSRRL
jgi:hypothetical protein